MFPLPPGRKKPPPAGYTGGSDRVPSDAQIEAWRQNRGDGNVAGRVPDGYISIDIDQYDENPGADSLAKLEAELGPLPPSSRTSSRGPDNPSGIRGPFKVPPGLRWKSDPAPGIQIVQPGHRYQVLPPSIHPEGRRYVRYGPGGKPMHSAAPLGASPKLPDTWVRYLRDDDPQGSNGKADLGVDELRGLLADMPAAGGEICQAVSKRLRAAVADCNSRERNRHDAVVGHKRNHVLALARLGEQGHTGAPDALKTLKTTFVAAVGPDRKHGGEKEATTEFDRGLAGALKIIGAKPTADGDKRCCGSKGKGKEPSGVKMPPPSMPLAVARVIEHDLRLDGQLTLRRWRDGWMRWRESHWAEVEPTAVSKDLYKRLEHAYYAKKDEYAPWAPTRRKVGDVLDALAAVTLLPAETHPPTRLDGGDQAVTVSCSNGLLDVATRTLSDHDPRYFNLVSVPFAYDPDAPPPVEWLKFMDTLWPDDPESIAALQEWFGYVVSGDTRQQKILLTIGPPRSGKGTIARTLERCIGRGNSVGPTLASLERDFGLQPLLGKSLAVIADARLSGRVNAQTIVERLLSISGEDTLTVDRKYREAWSGKLPTRLMVLSNELPNFSDASGAIASRFVIVSITESWLGREDHDLEGRITAELPSILNWALDGLDRLGAQGRFTAPAASLDNVIALADMASPTGAFVRDRCHVGPEHAIEPDRLFLGWRRWCVNNGRDHPGTLQRFSRDLRTVVPAIRTAQARVGGQRVRRLQGITLKNPADGNPTGVWGL